MYLWILAAVAAYFIKGLCGFANTLVFTSILSFGVANANISPIDLLLGYPTNLILTWKNRKRLVPKVYLPLAALVLAVPAWAQQQPGDAFVYDTAGLLTDDDRSALESMADQISWRYNCAVYIVTVDDYEVYDSDIHYAAVASMTAMILASARTATVSCCC